MEDTGTVSDSAAPVPDRIGARRRRTAADWAGLAVLAVGVLITGILVGGFGPLLAISCTSCQDGVRSPLRFGDALIAVAWYVVPLTTLGTVVGMFFPRGGARVAGIGMGILAVSLFVMLILGQFAA